VSEPVLSLRGIGKHYGGVTAVDGVDLDVVAGDVLAICGDNGAGKSTLIRIMAGAVAPDIGSIRLDGAPVRFRSPQDALGQGVATIYQELALAPRLSIAANVFLGAELTRSWLGVRLLDKARMRQEARAYLARLSVAVADVGAPVERLSGGQRQAVAICRALRWNARLIIMDEPTAALGVRETAEVLGLIRRLREEGRTIVLISHAMRDVVAVANRVAILRNGRKVIDRPLEGRETAEVLGRWVLSGEAV
jgi:ABC-type sugar transport system ATPase subunit